jgi:NTE family protein
MLQLNQVGNWARSIVAAVQTVPPRSWPPRRLSLALQGGGSFGAFTWGVLDRLLEEPDIAFDAVSGTSAGAVNGVLLAAGLAEGSRLKAREKLEKFWQKVSHSTAFIPFGTSASLAALTPSTATSTLSLWTRVLSPYQFNPFDLNPLRTALNEAVDFEQLRANPPLRLMVAATRVCDGRVKIFESPEINVETILASACLPLLHHAVTIDEEAYWDGGYAANPPLIHLVAETETPDVLVVQITPMKSAKTPTNSTDIIRRLDQITFNSSLLTEIEALSRFSQLCRGFWGLTSRHGRKQRRLRIHRVAAEEEFDGLAEASASNLDWSFLTRLRDSGRSAAETWLASENANSRPLALDSARRHLSQIMQ